MRFLNDKYLSLEKDIITIASIVFNIETVFRMGKTVSEVEIPISEQTAHDCNLNVVAREIQELLSFVLVREISISFRVIEDSTRYKRDKDLQFASCENVCLFSGGIDSLSGIIRSQKELKDVHGVFVAHGDQPRGVNIVTSLEKKLLRKLKIPVHILYAPPMKRYGYSQLRGFLYCLYGSVYVSLLKSKNLLITECGPTMYQPRFSPFDSVTMTTHPFVLGKAKRIIELLLRREVCLVIPYENLTKAEVIISSPAKEHFDKTHSCISLGTGRNDGKCYGCIVRRLGAIVAGVQDAEYDYDPITKDYEKGDNFVSLMRFSHDVLLSYETMNFFSKENIFVYKKQRLFKRFALDNFSAIYLLKKEGKVTSPYVENLYAAVLKKVGEAKLKEHISEVRKGRFVPNFKRRVGS